MIKKELYRVLLKSCSIEPDRFSEKKLKLQNTESMMETTFSFI